MKILKFNLLQGAGGLASTMSRNNIDSHLKELSRRLNFDYESQTQGYTHYVSVTDETYTILSLAWTEPVSWLKWTVVEEIPKPK